MPPKSSVKSKTPNQYNRPPKEQKERSFVLTVTSDKQIKKIQQTITFLLESEFPNLKVEYRGF